MRIARNLIILFLLTFALQQNAHSIECFKYFEANKIAWTINNKEKAKEIILAGSANVSRTKALGKNLDKNVQGDKSKTSKIAEKNFIEAIDFVLGSYEFLPVNLDSAIKINKILTKGLVAENRRGYPYFRERSSYFKVTDPFVKDHPKDFYTWLESKATQQAMGATPIKIAEQVHHNLAALDSFPDGNGRLSRLFSDLILIKNGYGPAYYTSMKDYFDRGNARSEVSREEKKSYYKEIVNEGQRMINSSFN